MRLAIGEILRCSSRSWHRPNAEFTLPNSMRPPIVLSRVGAQQAVPFFVPIHENAALRFVYSQVFRVDIQKMPSLSGPRLLLVPVVPVWRRRLSLCSPGKIFLGNATSRAWLPRERGPPSIWYVGAGRNDASFPLQRWFVHFLCDESYGVSVTHRELDFHRHRSREPWNE